MSRWFKVAATAALGALLGLIALSAQAEDRCSAKGVLAGKSYAMSSCAAAYFEDQHSVTLWFDEKPISAKEAEEFRLSAYAPQKRRLLQIAFCPGGGKATPDPKAVKAVDMRIDDGQSVLLDRQWLFELPKDKNLKIERLAGNLELGGTLSGRITGQRTSDGQPYSWEIDFAVKLPAKGAAAGLSCAP
jgi:hypothetical protein